MPLLNRDAFFDLLRRSISDCEPAVMENGALVLCDVDDLSGQQEQVQYDRIRDIPITHRRRQQRHTW